MPNRIIKESICSSDSIEQLTWFEEVFFYRLIVNCDDYGRFDARPQILKARLFPLKDVKEKQISEALDSLARTELIVIYQNGGRPYIQVTTWANHQTIRNKRSKYPSIDGEAHEDDYSCIQLIANVPVIQSNPIQSESNPNPNNKGVDEKILKYPPISAQINTFTNNGEYQTILTQFVEMRTKIKKAITPYAFTLIIKKLSSLSSDVGIQMDIVNQSIVNSWQDVYPLKKDYVRVFGAKKEKPVPGWYGDYTQQLKEQKSQEEQPSDPNMKSLVEDIFGVQKA